MRSLRYSTSGGDGLMPSGNFSEFGWCVEMR
jgi:hypothetical protein